MSEDRKTSDLDLSGLMDDGLRELIALVSSSGLTELKIERGGTKLLIRAASPARSDAVSVVPSALPVAAQEVAQPEAPEPLPTTAAVLSPIVGTYYAAPRPNADPFVEVGDYVEAGQTVGIIEAMKIMNEIECEVSGRVVEILVHSGQAVEYGTQLMLIDVSASSPA
ncbi:MAG: acetyl-CoA carboxylase biotin carboxyl carrier protein [Chloroflexota bacterium]|nr:acetyl-CoA carboxylase biotin carboxyl carrier protein [Chloroflexota bacterium]